MLRRHKGHKSRPGRRNSECGGEYWKSRYCDTYPCKATKVATHKFERRKFKRELSGREIGG